MRPTKGVCFGAGNGLRQREQQRQIAVDAFLFQRLGGADAFPRGGDLDQDALAIDAGRFVQGDQFTALGDIGLRVERQGGIDFSRDAPWNDLQDFHAKRDQEFVDHGAGGGAGAIGHGLGQQRLVFFLLDGFQDQRRIGGGVAGRKGLDRLKIAGIGHDGGELLELFELVHQVSLRLNVRCSRWHRGRPRPLIPGRPGLPA
jgi:hypothetical protein